MGFSPIKRIFSDASCEQSVFALSNFLTPLAFLSVIVACCGVRHAAIWMIDVSMLAMFVLSILMMDITIDVGH